MAKRIEEKVNIAELLKRSAIARSQLGKAHANLKQKLDVQSRFRDSIKTEPLKWIGGSVAAGLLGSILLGRGGKKKESSVVKKVIGGSIPGVLLKLGFKLAKPTIQVYATKMLKEYLEARFVSALRNGKQSDTSNSNQNR